MKALRVILVLGLLLAACMSEARQQGSYTDDWSSQLQSDICVTQGVPQILSASPWYSYAEPMVVYQRTNGDIAIWVPQTSDFSKTYLFIKLASGECKP